MTAKEMAIRALKRELAEAEDNLVRARMCMSTSNGDAPWGHSGQSLNMIVDGYRLRRNEIQNAIRELSEEQ